jgi:hypothetical protein
LVYTGTHHHGTVIGLFLKSDSPSLLIFPQIAGIPILLPGESFSIRDDALSLVLNRITSEFDRSKLENRKLSLPPALNATT